MAPVDVPCLAKTPFYGWFRERRRRRPRSPLASSSQCHSILTWCPITRRLPWAWHRILIRLRLKLLMAACLTTNLPCGLRSWCALHGWSPDLLASGPIRVTVGLKYWLLMLPLMYLLESRFSAEAAPESQPQPITIGWIRHMPRQPLNGVCEIGTTWCNVIAPGHDKSVLGTFLVVQYMLVSKLCAPLILSPWRAGKLKLFHAEMTL